jgi:hypothetical protein
MYGAKDFIMTVLINIYQYLFYGLEESKKMITLEADFYDQITSP